MISNPRNTCMSMRLLLCAGLVNVLCSAEPATPICSAPASTTVVISPLSIDEALKWGFFSQVIPVKEKEAVLIDTMDAKNQIILVHSITYFRGDSGQIYAVVNYLRPRPVPKP
jgi:hypothetical protein